MKPKIAVIFPSRGLCFSQTVTEVLANLTGIDHQLFYSHGNPIPECFNAPVNEALQVGGFSHFWFIEDDMILPPYTLRWMLEMDRPAVFCDYPVGPYNTPCAIRDPGGQAYITGTGCLLVRSELIKPFRTDVAWNIEFTPRGCYFTAKLPEQPAYGLHDVNFSLWLYQTTPIDICPLTLGQRKLVKLGQPGTNNGQHEIEEWTMIEPDRRAEDLFNWEAKRPDEAPYWLDEGVVTLPCLSPLVQSGKAKPLVFNINYATYDFSLRPELAREFMKGKYAL